MPPKLASQFDLIDRALDGHLEEILSDELARGSSLRSIAKTLAERGCPVSRETVRRWVRDRQIAA